MLLYFIAKFTQASGIGWVVLGLFVGLTRGSMKWEATLLFIGIFVFVLGYALERVLVKAD